MYWCIIKDNKRRNTAMKDGFVKVCAASVDVKVADIKYNIKQMKYYEALKKILKAEKYKFKSDTDSEVICALLDKLYFFAIILYFSFSKL